MVLLALGFAFERGSDGRHRFDQGLLEDVGGRPRAAVAGIGELHDAGAGLERQGGELEQPLGGFQLAVLELEAVRFHGAEQLLDAPAQTVEAHHLLRIGGVVDGQRRQQTPQQRLAALGRVDLDRLDEAEREAVWIAARVGAGRPRDLDGAGAHQHVGCAALVARPARRHTHLPLNAFAEAARRREQRAATDELAVGFGAHDQPDAGRRAGEMRVDVAFPVGDRHDLPRLAEQTTGGSGGLDPAGALLVLDRPRPLVGVGIASRVQMRACTTPSTASCSTSTTSRGWMKKPSALPSPAGPSPLRLRSAPEKLISVVSCTASTRRPAAALMVRSAAVAMMASCVTLALSRKRCVATSPARSPPILRTISEPD